MKHPFNILILLALCTSAFTFVSCQETEAISDYDNWEQRNQIYVDSIAKVCAENADGNWVRYCAYNRDELVESTKGNNNHYVYVHKNVNGKGSYSPQFNDVVRIHYLGHLIPSDMYKNGYIFDRSYNGYTLNEKTDVPNQFSVNNLVVGFTTALMNMVEGDDWTVYIPNELGYGDASTPVHSYSTLIFNVKLAKIYKYGIEEDYTWY